MSSFHDSDICRSIIDSLPTPMPGRSAKENCVLERGGVERITGQLRHEVIGHSCISETLLNWDQPGCEFCNEDCPVSRALKTSQSAQKIGFLHHKAGYEIRVRLRAVPVHNPHGSI